MTRRVLGVLALLAAGCVERGAPTAAWRNFDPDAFGPVEVVWTHPRGEASGGYAIEVRVPPAPFEVAVELPPTFLGSRVPLPASTPEGASAEIRVRALPDQDRSRASNVLVFRRAVRAPAVPGCCINLAGGAFKVAWTNRSAIAASLVVQRATFEDEYPFGPWTDVAALPASATSYEDRDLSGWFDGLRYGYRLVAATADEQSRPSDVVRTEPAPLAPLRSMVATRSSTGVRLTFEYGGRSAWAIEVTRRVPQATDFGFRETFYPTALGQPPAGQVPPCAACEFAARTARGNALGPPVFARVDESTATLAAAIERGPLGARVARTASGGFAIASSLYSTDSRLIAPGDDRSKAFAAAGSLGHPGVVVASDGRPHAVFATSIGSQAVARHAWHDGTAWRTEDVAQRASMGTVSFAIGRDDRVRASWSAGAKLEIATATEAGWAIDDLTPPGSPAGATWISQQLALDPIDSPHLVVLRSDGVVGHVFRDGGGAAQLEVLPVAAGDVWPRSVRAVFGGERGAVAWSSFDRRNANIVERSSAGWGTPRVLAFFPVTASIDAARSADGARLAVSASGGAADGLLWIREGDATAEHTWGAPYGEHALGFRGSKVWLAAGLLDENAVEPVERVVYLER